MSIGKRLTALLLSVLLLCALCGGASAVESPDLSKTGAITLVMKDGTTPVSGGTVELFKVGEIVETANGEITFALTDSFRDSGVSLDDVESASAAQDLADYADANRLTGTFRQISSDGEASYSSLPLGLYLVVQQRGNDGYELVNPFLVALPQFIDGTYLYQVNAVSKLSPASADSNDPSSTGVDDDPTNSPAPEETPATSTDPGPSGSPVDGDDDREYPGNPDEDEPLETESPAPTTSVTPTPSASTPTTNTSTPTTSTPTTPTGTTATTNKLPQTGQLKWPIPVMAMSGLVLMALGLRLRRRDKGGES